MAKIDNKSIARDLCSLQINTIIKDNITGNSMPKICQALEQISARYLDKLNQLSPPNNKLTPKAANVDYNRFNEYQSYATDLMNQLTQGETTDRASDTNLLVRIKLNSKRISEVLTTVGIEPNDPEIDDKLTHEEYIAIRKIWELGTEQIVMQTVIEIDGDVTTRIQSDYAKDEFATIHQLHRQSVDLSYNFWKVLINMVASVFESLFKPLLSRGS